MPRPLFIRNSSWDPLQDWPKSSILDQCWSSGGPFFLQPHESSWLNTTKKTPDTSSCSGFLSFPLVSPICLEVSLSPKDGQQIFSHAKSDNTTWRISLDVGHFCPEEIGVKINEDYLEIAGKHEERNNVHGIISRSFTRKYKLPAEADLQKMSSSISPEGLLLVEVPVGISSKRCPTETVIPIQKEGKTLTTCEC